MIVAREEASMAHQATGAWGRKTLDQIALSHAQRTPDKLALADFSDRAGWTTGQAEQLSYGELARRIDLFAAFFAALGLQPDQVAGLQMPPTVDAVVAFLALSRAGIVVAPMALAYAEDDLTAQLGTLGAKAIVTQGDVLGEPIGTRMRDVAAELFNIRFVFCAGDRVPDGLVELDRVLSEADSLPPAPEIARKGNVADHAITIALTGRSADGKPVPLARSHNHWLATGQMIQIEALIGAESVLVSPFALSGLAGLGVALAPWLLAGASLVLGLPSSVDALIEEIERHHATHVLIPAALSRRLVERMEAARVSATVIVIADGHAAAPADARTARIIDVQPLGEIGLVARRRRGDEIAPVPIGTIRAPADSDVAPVLLETRLQGQSQRAGDSRLTTAILLARGAMVPDMDWPPNGRDKPSALTMDGYISTGGMARLVSTSPTVARIVGPDSEHYGIGATAFALGEVDLMLTALPGIADAAAIPLADGSMVAAIVPAKGAFVDPAGLIAALGEKPVGRHKLPDHIVPVAAIPRDEHGAIERRALAELLSEPV